jgi:serine/threonine-protein kinase mTOR
LKIIDGKNTDPPRAILSFFLDLAHFLELSDIDKERLDQPGGSLKAFGGLNGIGKLADCAERTDAYAKALHYREMEFLYKTSEKDNKEKERKIAESLIKSFQKLGEQEAAEGVLEFAKSNDISVNAEWFEKLNRWEEAKKRYADGNDNPYDQLGYMRCLEALGEWDELCSKTYEFDEEIEDQKIESVKLGTTAAWHLGNWDEFQRLHSIIPVNTFDGAFYRAVHSVQHSRYEEARKWTMEARKDLETSLTMQDKNYSRVYGTVFNAQLCSELEEVIEHRTANRQRQIAIQEMWESRLCGTSSDDGQRVDGVQLVIEEWQKILLLRSLVKQQNTAAFPRDDTEEHFNIRNG